MNDIRNRVFVRLFATVVLLPGLLLATAGCEESVDAIIGTEIPFTIWGFLDVAADTQYVRVFEVTDQLIPDRDAKDRCARILHESHDGRAPRMDVSARAFRQPDHRTFLHGSVPPGA